ncbi:MAG: toll/interleukin-1 receptor domain-containing protein [Ignavibacteriae bacterium]|nr:toll/interleukin-1 receptor domain-containing protein [Ignavibacteriota bacterium]
MPTVFISYSHHDTATATLIVAQLKEKGVLVWRDGESILPGEAWPRAIGEGIAENDCVLLLWSKAASISEPIELEWTTCIALKKPIMPVLLDDTPLPLILRAKQGIAFNDPNDAVARIVERLAEISSPADGSRQAAVIETLSALQDDEGKSVRAVADARQEFEKQGWLPRRRRSVLWPLLAASIIAVIAYIYWPPSPVPIPATQELLGRIQDAKGMFVDDALVSLGERGDVTAVSQLGEFRFGNVKGKQGDSVRLSISKAGFHPVVMYVHLPGPVIATLTKIPVVVTKRIRLTLTPNPLHAHARLVKQSIRLVDRNGQDVASPLHWNASDLIVRLPEGEYKIVVSLRFKTESGYGLTCSKEHPIAFDTDGTVSVPVACVAH